MAHDVFVSYSQRDKPTADDACAALEAAGIRCWIAPRDVPAGMSWPSAIVGAISQSRVMVLVFSSHAVASDEVQREVAQAFQNGVVVVPLRIEDVRPSGDMAYYMSTTHWLDAMTPPLEAHLQRLCQQVQANVPASHRAADPEKPQLTPTAPWQSKTTEPKASTVSARLTHAIWQSAANYLSKASTVSARRTHDQPNQAKATVLKGPTSEPTTTFVGTRAGQTREDNSLKMKLVWIPPGKFTMGSPKDATYRFADERPLQVTLTRGFWLGQHEVTQAEWQRVMQTTPWSGNISVKEGDDYPATYVSSEDAMNFCEKLTEQEHSAGRLPSDWRFTLPTEAQWEYACRGESKTRYSFGDDESNLGDYAWFTKNANDAGEKYAHLVGQKKANPWRLSDMHGNVYEWCSDYYAEKRAGGTDPQGPSEGSNRAIRGGSWTSSAGYCRSALRYGLTPGNRSSDVGFRVALVPCDK